jgi:hypothetical protein
LNVSSRHFVFQLFRPVFTSFSLSQSLPQPMRAQ